MTPPGQSYTPQQRKLLEVLHDMGPMRPYELAGRISTNQSGLSHIVNNIYGLVAWAHEPEVFFIPREQARQVYELVSEWQR